MRHTLKDLPPDRRDLEIQRLRGQLEAARQREGRIRTEERERFSLLTAASKRFAHSMRSRMDERQRQQRRLDAQYAVSRVLEDSGDLSEAAPEIFRVLGERLGWDVGVLWTVEVDALRCGGVWRAAGRAPNGFEEACRGCVFRRGADFPGRVWRREEACWVGDVLEDQGFLRKEAAAEADLRCALAFPIQDGGGGLVGVFELLKGEVSPVDEDLVRVAYLVGHQIGQFVERRRAEEALRKSAGRAAFRAELTEALRPLADPAKIKAEASRVLGQHLEANRVIYGEISLDDWMYLGGSEYLDGAGSIAGRLDLDDYDPALLENFQAGRTVVAPDLSNDAALTAERLATFEAAQVRAHVSVPLVKNGRLVAALGVNQTSPRAWTAEEIALVEETAERTWAAVERARAEEALRRSEERYRTLFEKIDEGFCIIDVVFDEAHSPTDYRFVETNPAFERMTGLERTEGRTARELVPNLEEWWFETYGKVALTGEAVHFENHSEAMGRWFEVRASRIGGQESRKVALVFDDITERKRAAEERDRLLAREWVAVAEAAERERISRELHDRVAHSMGVAHQSLELHDVLAGEDAVRAEAKLDLAREMIKASLESTRNLSAELRRLDAEDGLEAELRHLLDVSVPPGIRADIRVDGDEADVPGHVRGQLFLMLREAVRNAVSHSGCGSLSIGLDITPERIVGSVEDDGQGFDNDAGNGGVGLRSMRERAALLDGDLELDCEPGRGTRVELCVPLMEGR